MSLENVKEILTEEEADFLKTIKKDEKLGGTGLS